MRGLLLAALALQARAELTISTFAGAPADRRQIDGPAAVAQFERTAGIVSGGGGNFYLSDVRTIRKISPDGSVSTAAGRGAFSGSRTGQGAFVFVEPHHYLACGGGYVFFASGCIIQRLEIATGLVIEYAGVGCGFQDGASAYFSNPRGMVVAPDGTLYIADHSNHVIRKVTTDRVTSTLAGLPLNAGYADGNGTNARFNAPTDVTIDNDGNLYVADYGNARIRKISPGGLVFTFAGGGICPRQDGNGPDACFGSVLGLTVDASGNLYVADTDTFPPKTFIRKITPAADVTTIGETPSGYVHGTIAFHDGFLHLAILDESRVVRMNLSGTVSHFTGTSPPVAGLVNGPRTTARFNLPAGIDSDSGGSLFISETGNDDVRKIDATGLVSTFASGFDDPSDVAVDASGNVYVSDTNNHVIWRITPAGAASVFAGSVGMPGYQEGTGTSARFNMPAGIHVSGTTVHVADAGNRVIRRINSLRETTLVAGLPGVAGTSDGPGFNARFNATRDVVADSSGNLFVSDGFAIRSVDTMGNV
ncbi:MAG TPA: hypothetical protein VNL91_05675, partial [Thermoanaerobaculia bacterium]|nr:hypothetical protein [Thermoanaerobaculia bacterium]